MSCTCILQFKFFNECKPIIVPICVSHLVQWGKKKGIPNNWSHSLKPVIDQNSQGFFVCLFHRVTWLLANILVPFLETVHVTFFTCLWKTSCGLSLNFLVIFSKEKQQPYFESVCSFPFVFKLFNLHASV